MSVIHVHKWYMCSILIKQFAYRTNQYEHLEEEIMSLAPLFTEI